MSQDPESRIKCQLCDRQILHITAKVNNGLCGHCARDEKRKKFDEIVESWIANPSTLPGSNGIPEPTDMALSIRAAQLRFERTPLGQLRKICDEFFDCAHDKWTRDGSIVLTLKEKHVLAVETFLGEISNGGIIQYLGNESYAFANWAAEGFERIDIPEYAGIAKEIVSLFPQQVVPEDSDECWNIACKIDPEILGKLEKSFFEQYDSVEAKFIEKLYAYILK